jgi:carboxypeptidase Q
MRLSLTVLTALTAIFVSTARAQSITERYRAPADRIIAAATADSTAYDRLGRLVDTFGNRISGSENLERAIDWVLAEMKKDGLRNAHTEPVMVPHWVRGTESAELVLPRHMPLPMLGLGGSVATPGKGITADVLVVNSFDDLTARAAEAKGRIVLFDVPFTTYDSTVRYRWGGASAAARVGAVAALVRSVTPYSIRSPHTGGMGYDTTVARIPTAALTVEDTKMLHRMQDRGERIVVTLKMQARMLPDASSRNVMAELVGSEHPDEVVVMGGHIDSWDVGQGAMDDGGGLVVAWEAVRLLQRLGLHPRRTIRVVGWTNEENGGRGGRAYRDARIAELDKQVLAIESDAGVFRPHGFDFGGTDSAYAIVREIGSLLAPIQADSMVRGSDEADVGPLKQKGVPVMGLRVDETRYFWYHHTQGDTLDKLDPADMARCVAAMAVMAYVAADLPEPLPR